jgi:hypothetical protein
LKEEIMTTRITLAMLPVLFGIGLGAGLGVSAPATAQSQEVKIGLIAPMSGLSFPKIPSGTDSRREAESLHQSDRCL